MRIKLAVTERKRSTSRYDTQKMGGGAIQDSVAEPFDHQRDLLAEATGIA